MNYVWRYYLLVLLQDKAKAWVKPCIYEDNIYEDKYKNHSRRKLWRVRAHFYVHNYAERTTSPPPPWSQDSPNYLKVDKIIHPLLPMRRGLRWMRPSMKSIQLLKATKRLRLPPTLLLWVTKGVESPNRRQQDHWKSARPLDLPTSLLWTNPWEARHVSRPLPPALKNREESTLKTTMTAKIWVNCMMLDQQDNDNNPRRRHRAQPEIKSLFWRPFKDKMRRLLFPDDDGNPVISRRRKPRHI